MGLQFTIDKPDSVSRVTPPKPTIIKIIVQQMSNHTPIVVLPSLILYVDETDIDLFAIIRAVIGVRDHTFGNVADPQTQL